MESVVELIVDPRRRRVGSGEVRRVLPFARRRMVGPFIFCDLIGPEHLAAGERMDIDAHPHIGLSTLTYLTEGRLRHRDSTGAVQTIEPGAVNWMTAGSGVTHTERTLPDDDGRTLAIEGVQCWVALPDEAQDGPAFFEHAPAAEIPTAGARGSGVQVAVGTGFGEASPISGSSPMVFALVDLHDGDIRLEADHPERAVLALDDGVSIGDTSLTSGQLAVIERAAVPTIGGAGRCMVLGGEPLGQRHIWWNFVHSDLDAIEAAKKRWTDQDFDRVPGDHDVFVPLPPP